VADCPVCGSDRLIPLSFPSNGEEILDEVGERPHAKCAVCGNRIYDPGVLAGQDSSKGSAAD
jgi:hypothetical protein